jgi:AcrR family transcriptional regulator
MAAGAKRLRETAVRAESEGIEPTDSVPDRNLAGQRLGRKGRDTRDRILAALNDMLDNYDRESSEQISLSAVARRASLRMSSIYNYFNDFTEVVLAVLEPVMVSAESAYLQKMSRRWADEELDDRCLEFVTSYHYFWARNSHLLHLRNAMADRGDQRMMRHRVASTQPIIRHLMMQMDVKPDRSGSYAGHMATMTMIGIERSVTIATDRFLPELMGWDFSEQERRFLKPGARLLELAIRDVRAGEGL